MADQKGVDGATYFCEEVSQIEYRDGLFYLTDRCGEYRMRRAMRPSTFFRCVAHAARVIEEFERANGAVFEFTH